MSIKKRLTRLLCIASLPFLLVATAQAADDVKLDRSMIWSAYDVGSSGYTEASAIADAMMKKYGTRIRIMPSGTSIGRLLPLKTGRVKYAFLATETYFASEAIYDFAAAKWGPQNLRVLLGRPSSVGLATAADAHIKTLKDLRGKRVAYVEGAPSLNVKAQALLAFGGLTWDDVVKVQMPSYASSLHGLTENKVDAAIAAPAAPALFELESSPRGIAWPAMPMDDKAGWARVDQVAPIFSPTTETVGAGMSEKHPVTLIGYRYPEIVCYAKLAEDEAYNMTKAVAESYDLFKDANKVMPRWDAKRAGKTPVDVPFHKGAIRYLKEAGVWTATDTEWNNKRIKRMDAVQAAWKAARKEAAAKGVGDDGWKDFWMAYRKSHLD